jgi:macrolide transport system ATP-binding/permease protein
MRPWHVKRLFRLPNRTRDEIRRDVSDEFAFHLDMRTDELTREGRSPAEARAQAVREFGKPDTSAGVLANIQDRVERRRRFGQFAAELWQDAAVGLRLLARSPGFALVVVFTLGLGIAANTTTYTVINSVLLTPVPVDRPAELVGLYTRGTENSASAGAQQPLSYLNLTDLQADNDVFVSLAGHSGPLSLTLTQGSKPERLFGEIVTANYFETLGVRPSLGRFFRAEEDRAPSAHPVVVIGHGPWQSRFGGGVDVVGRTIRINGVEFTVIGVAPKGFKGLDAVFGPDVWIPAMMTAQVVPAQQRSWLTDRAALGFRGVGRLRPGVTEAQAESNVTTIAATLERDYPDANRGRTIGLEPISRASLLGVSPSAALLASLALMAVPGLVLLIACSNVANLLLSAATTRRQEIAVRLALGAGRARLVRQLLTESALLGLLAGAAGLGLAYAGARLLWSFFPPEFAKNLVELRLDLSVVLFAFVTSVVTTLIFGAAPALEASRPDLVAALKDDARAVGQHRRLVGWRHALLVGQVAMSFVALMTAALLLRSVQQSYVIDPGFERHHMGIMMMSPGQAGYDRPRAEQLYRDIRARVEALPGVTSMSWATNLPLFTGPSRTVLVEGREIAKDSEGIQTVVNTVDLDYFATAGVAVLRGRDFADADRSGSLPVAIVNDTMARKYWPNRDPIGQRFSFAGDSTVRQIVGIARTANYDELGEAPKPCVYLPLAQNFADAVVLYVRTAGDPANALTAVQREVRQLESQIDVSDVRTASKVIDQALFGSTMGVGLLGVFGLVALGLASLGMYGVMAHGVSLRRREIGVRMALGASGGVVQRMVVRQGMRLVGIGLLLGGVASVGVGVGLSRVLYGVSAVEPLGLIGATAVLMAVAALACYLPARRASRLDPLTTLRTT